MMISDYFQIGEDYAAFRPAAKVSLEEVIALCLEAIRFAGEQGISRLLINLHGLGAFESPSVAKRFWFIENAAAVAKPGLKLVLVVKPEMIDSQRFGVTVARNRGLEANIFGTEEEARVWLLASAPVGDS